MSEDLSQVACACASWDSGTGTGCPWDFRVLVLLSEPYPGDPDNDDPEEGRRIVEVVKASGSSFHRRSSAEHDGRNLNLR